MKESTAPIGEHLEIVSNGSKWAGEEPDSIDKLLEVLSEYTLDPIFEKYEDFVEKNPIGYLTNKPMYSDRDMWHFFGNFFNLSHVFNIYTDDMSIIDKLTVAIEANKSTEEYAQAKIKVAEREEKRSKLYKRSK